MSSVISPVTKSVQVVTPSVTKSPAKRKKRLSDFHRLADLCGVTPRTVQNWDAKGAPLIAMRLLYIYDRQDLSGHGYRMGICRFIGYWPSCSTRRPSPSFRPLRLGSLAVSS